MRLSPQLRMDIGKVAVITVFFLLINFYLAFHNLTILNSPFSLGPSPSYDFRIMLLVATIIGLIAGIVGGTVLVFINGRYFRKKSFRYAMLSTAMYYTMIFIFITVLVNTIIARIELGASGSAKEITAIVLDLIFDMVTLAYFILWGTITLLTLFFLQVNDKFGPGILKKFIIGKYHKPREELRIFMFLDMKSSTTIAEKIGNKQYFNLLSDAFADLTGSIIASRGEIYQYVGDEIVISWSLKKGLADANCLNCFIRIQKKLEELSPFYEKKYGLVPEFKAGLHFGMVTAGEIGSIKKDIIYSGDVLNTTARIQELCNQYKIDFLASKQTLDLIEDKGGFELVHIGNIELRGKENKIDLNTIRVVS